MALVCSRRSEIAKFNCILRARERERDGESEREASIKPLVYKDYINFGGSVWPILGATDRWWGG